MTLTTERAIGKGRFDALLTGASAELHDMPLLKRDDWVVAPTLGAIVPGWLLAIPRQPVLSFRDWAATGGPSAMSVLTEVRAELGLAADEVVWFEHGPERIGTVVGCGLDHAHLHVLVRPPFSFADFMERARMSAALEWRETSLVDGYEPVAGDGSYCIAGCGEAVISARNVEATGSQFFRRVVAGLTDGAAGWDYRNTPHSRNIEATVSIFERLTSRKQREG